MKNTHPLDVVIVLTIASVEALVRLAVMLIALLLVITRADSRAAALAAATATAPERAPETTEQVIEDQEPQEQEQARCEPFLNPLMRFQEMTCKELRELTGVRRKLKKAELVELAVGGGLMI